MPSIFQFKASFFFYSDFDKIILLVDSNLGLSFHLIPFDQQRGVVEAVLTFRCLIAVVLILLLILILIYQKEAKQKI